MKKYEKSKVNWHRLSSVEFASALEVYWIAHCFNSQPEVQRSILEHTLDEYKHSGLFKKMADQTNPLGSHNISIHCLMEWGGVSRENHGIGEVLKASVGFLNGERRAETALKALLRRVEDPCQLATLNLILQDEERHISAIERYIKKKNILSVTWIKTWLTFQHLIKRVYLSSTLESLRDKALSFLVRSMLRFPIERFTQLPSTDGITLRESIKDAERVS